MARMKTLELDQLVDQMTTSMLGVGVEEVPRIEPAEAAARRVIGCVHLTADQWSGSVLVSLDLEDAVRATATMFMLDESEADEELVADAVGEFANVLAGMIKTEIGGGCSLSLPTVTAGGGLRLTVPGATPVDERRFSCDVGHIDVATLETP